MPYSISKRISNTSSDKKILTYATLFHNNLLSVSRSKENLTYPKDDKITRQQNFVRRENSMRNLSLIDHRKMHVLQKEIV